MRFAALSIVVVTCLVAPGHAAAHSRSPAVALDYRLELSRAALPGVHAHVVDGDRSLRVRVEPPHRLLVLGLLGEPFLRFGPNGVWVNRASPSADADRLARRGTGWVQLADGAQPALARPPAIPARLAAGGCKQPLVAADLARRPTH